MNARSEIISVHFGETDSRPPKVVLNSQTQMSMTQNCRAHGENKACCQMRVCLSCFSHIKFIYSEKATKFCEISTLYLTVTKGQLIPKANYQAVNSSKKWTSEFIFTTMRHVFVHFLEEIEDNKETFRNYL